MLEITRQGYYKKRRKKAEELLEEEIIIDLVKEIRRRLPRLGGRKLYYLLKEDLAKLPSSPGRDKFFGILRKYRLLIKPLKQYVRTTNSHHRFRIHSNLLIGLLVDAPNKVFVSDITYIPLPGDFCFLFLVTDVYSRKIVGYYLSMSLAAKGAVIAMKKALRGVTNTDSLIHHSDRGFQYCCEEYVSLLSSHNIKISMGEAGNPYDNAIAERVNGILKNEFYLNGTFKSFDDAKKSVREAINNYNTLRPNMSIGYMTPEIKYAA
jgi:putative transposase